jgi:hypothetical protein
MATRYGRRTPDGIYEYHDSKESLVEAERRDQSDGREVLFWMSVWRSVAWSGRSDRFGLVVAGAGTLLIRARRQTTRGRPRHTSSRSV